MPHSRSANMLTVVILCLIIGLGGVAGGIWLGRHHHETASSASRQLWTCGMHPQVIRDHPGNCPICGMALTPVASADAATADDPSDGIRIDPVIVQNMGVRVMAVTRGPLSQTARAYGVIEEATPNIRDINLRVSGWVEKLHANVEGAHIRKGEALFDLYSPELKQAIDELISARRTSGNDRNSELFFAAAREKLRLWGLEPDQIDHLAKLDQSPATVTFRSPITGHLVGKDIVEGAMIRAGERALRIVDHSLLWLDAQVHGQDLPLVKIGRKVTATIEGQPGRTFEGEVIFIHPHMDLTTRTARVRIALPNPQMTLRPGMYATVQLSAQVANDALLIPREAVIDTGDRQVAFVARGAGHFEPRTLAIGLSGGNGLVQVLDGLREGEQVVTSGQFLLDSESRMREALAKHMKKDLLAPPATEPAAPPQIIASQPSTGPWNAAVDQLVLEYLKVAVRLGEIEHNKDPIDAAVLLEAAESLNLSAAAPPQKTFAADITRASEAFARLPLDGQRAAFKPLSDAVIRMIDQYPPSAAVGQKLYVMYCVMEKGYWLGRSEKSANPYYATTMKTCAEVKRAVAVKG